MHVAHIDHAGVVGHEVRDQGLDLTEPHRERSPPDERPHTDARVAVVANRHVLVGRTVDIVDFVDRGANEGVPAKAFTVVDLRLVELKGECRIGLDRQTTGKEAWAALGRGGVRAGEGEAVAVGETNVLTLPAEVGEVEFAGAEHDLRQFAIDQVAVGVERRRKGRADVDHGALEPVEVAQRLEPLERRMGHDRVEHAGVANGRGVLAKFVGRDIRRVRKRRLGDIGIGLESECFTSRVDIALRELDLATRLVGLDLEPLHERRVDAAHDDGDERPQADGDDRQGPAPLPQVEHEQHDRRQRDGDQQIERRQLRIDIGVERTVDHPSSRDGEFVALQPVVGSTNHGEDGEDRREVHLDTRRRALTGRGRHADTAIQVVRDDREDEDDDEGGERPIDHIGQERQLEEIEADVGAELRVGDPEVLTVDEQQPLFPLRLHTGGGEQGEEKRHHRAHQPRTAGDEIVVAGEEFLLRAGYSSLRRRAVGEEEVEPQQGEEHPEEDEGQDDLGAQHRAPHIGSVERVEPEEVGVEPCDSSQRQGDDDERGGEHGQHDSASPTEPGGTTSLRHLFYISHGRTILPVAQNEALSALRSSIDAIRSEQIHGSTTRRFAPFAVYSPAGPITADTAAAAAIGRRRDRDSR